MSARPSPPRRRLGAICLLSVAAAALLLAGLPLAGCGDGGTTTTVIERTEPSATGPRGSLDFTGVGPVKQGRTTDQARKLFGPPDRTGRVSGCELNPSSEAEVVWIWDLADGELTIAFSASDDTMIRYRTTSAKLPTTLGSRVGDSFQSIRDAYGSALRPLNLGRPSTPQSGHWYVDGPRTSQLIFLIEGGRATSILGGYTPPCE